MAKKPKVIGPEPAPAASGDGVLVTWLGGEHEPDSNEWNGIVFKKGEAVLVNDQRMVAKARTNRFFSVEGDAAPDEPAADSAK